MATLVDSRPASAGKPSAPAPSGRLDSLTGLRWWAALLVFGEHAGKLALSTAPGSDDPSLLDRFLHAVFGTGFVGVSCFFILSGFVLAWSRQPGDTVRRFWRRRFAKIYPVFFVTTLLAVVWVVTSTGVFPGLRLILTHLTLLQSWVPDQTVSYGLNPVAWSLSCEAFFYFCFPALYAAMAKARTVTLRWVAAGCVAAAFLLPYLAGQVFMLKAPSGSESIATEGIGGPFMYWFVYVFPVMRLAEFACGIALACLVRRGAWRGPGVPVAIGLSVVAIWLGTYLPEVLQRVAVTFVPFALLIAALAQADVAGRWSPLRSRPMVFLGEISFALYMVQLIFIVWTGVHLRGWLHSLGLLPSPTAAAPMWLGLTAFLLYLVVCAFLAWILYAGVEKPMMRVLRPRPAATPAPAAPSQGG
ncbi:acyltransferase [Streptomyces sp. CS149]|uniref:acyltransferase family protein n=1 Tax=Streptomyces sp. CS149 TaxID=2109332 RepID=UPI000D1C2050|nr:acyltransferase [Streptomyces sp. CS149]PSK71847.1 acyltransferase [Streptomyces sp. CS149]